MRYTVRPISDRTVFTGKHRRSAFDSTWSATLNLLFAEVRQLKGRDLVMELDVAERDIRIDGMVRANARPASPAVRIAFESMHGPLTYGTDAFDHWQDNVRAIALGLEALRKVDRYGITKRGEQYTGFKALGAGRAMPASHMTTDEARETLIRLSSWSDLDDFDPWGSPQLVAKVVRSAKFAAHPDRNNGDQTAWDQVEQAATVLGLDR